MNGILKEINIDDINLDLENPRIPLSIRKKDKSKSHQEINNDILEYLIKTGSLIELMLSIGENGFFSGEALLLIEDIEEKGKYIVIEGNRRVTALKLLLNPGLATVSKNQIKEASETATHKPTKIPSIIFNQRSEIQKYLGYRHITGIKNWSSLEKARYMKSIYELIKNENRISELNDEQIYQEIAKSIGSQRSYVKRILKAYKLYEYIEEKDFFNIPDLDDTKFYFVNLSDSLNKENIANFLTIDMDDRDADFNKKHLEEWTHWLYEKNTEGDTRLKGQSHDLSALNDVLGNEEAAKLFRARKLSLSQAIFMSEDSGIILRKTLEEALMNLSEADRVIVKIDDFTALDSLDETLLEIRRTAKKIFDYKRQQMQDLDDEL